MKVKLLVIGKTDHKELESLISEYDKRLQHYLKFELEVIPGIKSTKNLSENEQKEKEGAAIIGKLQPADLVVLLDENGKQFSSLNFSSNIQKKLNSGIKQVVYIVGGPYGFSDAVYKKSAESISLSKMTFSHQMVRLFFIEQLYRACTILRNEPYHHQ
jgi:23S rRNA (pseudouridine1915-N3)-methyltransferase